MHCVIVSYLVHSFSNDYKIKTKTDDFYKFESVSCRFKSETLHSFTMWVARSDWRTASNVTIRVAESLSEGVGGFWWSRIPNNTRGRSRIFFVRLRLWKSNWIFFYFTLLSWEFLLKWYNFFWNFYWNREFLLCTTVSIDWWSLQNCWQPSFHSRYVVESEIFGKGGAGVEHSTSRPRKPGNNDFIANNNIQLTLGENHPQGTAHEVDDVYWNGGGPRQAVLHPPSHATLDLPVNDKSTHMGSSSRQKHAFQQWCYPVSSEISGLCEISDLLLLVSYFASQSKGIRFGVYFFDVCCV